MKNWFSHVARVASNGFCFLIFGVGLVLISVLFAVFIRWLPVGPEVKRLWLVNTVRSGTVCFVNLTRLLGISGHSYSGEQHLRTSGKIIVANHPSLVDVLYIGAKTDNLCCIVKKELWHNPLTSYIVRLAGYIPNHSETLLDDAKAALDDGKNLLIFPEGTRNVRGDQLEFKRGAAHIALYANSEVVPVVVHMTPRAMQKGEPWYKIPTSRFIVNVAVYPALDKLDCGVDIGSPVTLQARQFTTFLLDFYRKKVIEFDAEPASPVLVPHYKQPAGPHAP